MAFFPWQQILSISYLLGDLDTVERKHHCKAALVGTNMACLEEESVKARGRDWKEGSGLALTVAH